MKHSNLARAPVFLLPFLLVPFPAPREAGGDPVKVSIKKNAEALPGGQEVDVRVKASCDPIGEVLEAFVQIHQGDFFGDGFFTPICDGVPRSYLVRVIVLEGALEARTPELALLFVDRPLGDPLTLPTHQPPPAETEPLLAPAAVEPLWLVDYSTAAADAAVTAASDAATSVTPGRFEQLRAMRRHVASPSVSDATVALLVARAVGNSVADLPALLDIIRRTNAMIALRVPIGSFEKLCAFALERGLILPFRANLVDGFRLAFVVLAAMATCGLVCSALRGRANVPYLAPERAAQAGLGPPGPLLAPGSQDL